MQKEVGGTGIPPHRQRQPWQFRAESDVGGAEGAVTDTFAEDGEMLVNSSEGTSREQGGRARAGSRAAGCNADAHRQ